MKIYSRITTYFTDRDLFFLLVVNAIFQTAIYGFNADNLLSLSMPDFGIHDILFFMLYDFSLFSLFGIVFYIFIISLKKLLIIVKLQHYLDLKLILNIAVIIWTEFLYINFLGDSNLPDPRRSYLHYVCHRFPI